MALTDIIQLITGLATSGVVGAVTGLIGTAVTSIVNYKNQKLQNEFKLKMREFDVRILEANVSAIKDVAEATAHGAADVIEADAFRESVKQSDSPPMLERWGYNLFNVQGKVMRFFAIPCAIIVMFLLGILDFIKALMRPAITIYLILGSTLIAVSSWDFVVQSGLDKLDGKKALDIFVHVINIVLYLTVSTITWWFGDRRTAKFIHELNTQGKLEKPRLLPSSVKVNVNSISPPSGS